MKYYGNAYTAKIRLPGDYWVSCLFVVPDFRDLFETSSSIMWVSF